LVDYILRVSRFGNRLQIVNAAPYGHAQLMTVDDAVEKRTGSLSSDS